MEQELYPHEDEVERLGEVPAELAGQIRAKAIAAGCTRRTCPPSSAAAGWTRWPWCWLERELGRASYALQMLVERPSNILQGCEGDQRRALPAPGHPR